MKKVLGSFLLSFFLAMPAFAAVDLNSATQAELESVKGIGPTKAKAILDHRSKNGPFKSVSDLAKVKGFGKASVAKIEKELTAGEAKPADPAATAKK